MASLYEVEGSSAEAGLGETDRVAPVKWSEETSWTTGVGEFTVAVFASERALKMVAKSPKLRAIAEGVFDEQDLVDVGFSKPRIGLCL